MPDRRRALVLGVSGFIGRHVNDALEVADDEVIPVGIGRSSGPRPWRAVDLATADLDTLLGDAAADVVINCAGRTHGTQHELIAANLTLVARLLEALARRPARLVHIGSSAEYGPAKNGHATREDDPVRPAGPYGVTKLGATELVRSSGIDATVLRVFNPVGAGMAPDSMPGRAAAAIAEALAGGADTISMGDLSASRDFIDVRDVAAALVAASRVHNLPPVINLGSGRATLARELVAELAGVAGFMGLVLEKAAGSSRSEAVDYQCADIGLARRHLAWEPMRSLRDAVTELWSGVSATPM